MLSRANGFPTHKGVDIHSTFGMVPSVKEKENIDSHSLSYQTNMNFKFMIRKKNWEKKKPK